ELLKSSHDLDTGTAIEISRGLIRQNYFRAVDQGACNGNTLLLTARKLTRIMFFAPTQSDRSQNSVGFDAQFCVGQTMRTIKQRQFHVFARRCAGQEIEILEDESDFRIANISEF